MIMGKGCERQKSVFRNLFLLNFSRTVCLQNACFTFLKIKDIIGAAGYIPCVFLFSDCVFYLVSRDAKRLKK